MEYEIVRTDDELAHHGIKGMRWGVRLYQRKDGSLTTLGKLRLQKRDGSLSEAGKKFLAKENVRAKKEAEVLKNRKATQAKFDKLNAKRKANEESDSNKEADKKSKSADKPKTIDDMSDEELARAINRIRAEQTYAQLTYKPEEVGRGKQFMNAMKDKAISKFSETAVNLASDYLKKKVSKLIGLDEQKLDKYAEAERLSKYWTNVNKAKQQRDQYERNVANDRKPNNSKSDDAKQAEKEAKAAAKKAEKEAKKVEKLNKDIEDDVDRIIRQNEEKIRNNKYSKVFEGTVEGTGNSSKKAESGKKWTDDSPIIDADYYEIVNDSSVSYGRSYVTSLYGNTSRPSLPAPGLPSPKDDD